MVTETTWSRIRRSALWLLFATVLLIPKTLGLRRKPRLWNLLRLFAVVIGVGLAVAWWFSHAHAGTAIAGILLLVLAALIPPERKRLTVDARAKELGAVIVVEGGRYRATPRDWVETRLFLGMEKLWLLDTRLQVILEMPLARLGGLQAEPVPDVADGSWRLRLGSGEGSTELVYQGPFAEHFARVAESTVRSQLPNPLPILRQH